MSTYHGARESATYCRCIIFNCKVFSLTRILKVQNVKLKLQYQLLHNVRTASIHQAMHSLKHVSLWRSLWINDYKRHHIYYSSDGIFFCKGVILDQQQELTAIQHSSLDDYDFTTLMVMMITMIIQH